jgi:hypothetical protein
MRRTSYQKGSLRLADRKKGKVWEFLWREVQLDGTIRRKHIVIGTQEDLPTESSAQAVVDAIRLEINQQTPQRLIKNISFETLVNHYRQHELPDTFNKTKPGLDAADEDRKSYSTQVTYEGYLKKWILPRWRSCRLTDVKATEVEKWLKSLCFPKTGVPLARGSRAKIRNIMSAIYSHAIRWEWTEKNPITSVRQSAKRQKAPDVLTPEEIMAFLKELPDPLRTMIELDAFTGLRRGELIGLRWQDVDFENPYLAHTSIGSGDGRRCTENGGFSERCSVGCTNGRVAVGMETAFSVRWSERLGIRLAAHERPTAVLARNVVAILRQAGFAACQGDEASFVSHLSAHLFDAAECKRGESQGRAGTASPRESESHDRCLHAGSRSTEARGTEQFGQTGAEGRGFGDQAGLSGSNWIMKRSGGIAEAVYFVGVPDGI